MSKSIGGKKDIEKWGDIQNRVLKDMAIIDATYKDKWFVHRVIRFLRDRPERAPDYIDFVPDWETRELDEQ
jgi:hypothetical protein